MFTYTHAHLSGVSFCQPFQFIALHQIINAAMDPKPSDGHKSSGAPKPSCAPKKDDASEDEDALSERTLDPRRDDVDSGTSISLLSYDELKQRYDELPNKYDGLRHINNELTVELACLKNKVHEVDGQIFVDAPEAASGESEDTEGDAKRPKADHEASWVYHMHEELVALREVHAEFKKRYARGMADAALSVLELRQKYDKYIEWITEKCKQLKQAPPEKALRRNAFGLPIHQDQRFNKKCLWCHKDKKDVEDWDPEFAGCSSCSGKLWWMKISPLPV